MKTFSEAQAAFAADRASLAERGVIALDSAEAYVPEHFGNNFGLALDAQPALVGTPNSGIPSFLTTLVDPSVFEVVLAPNKGSEVLGEVKKGTWLDETALFPTVERTGEVSSYGDHNENGLTGVNSYFPQRQSYLFQTIKQYGEREIERAGLARINWVSQIDKAAATVLGKFMNLSYHFGVAGLQNYGLLNDPGIAVNGTLTPATKAAGGTRWISAGGALNATANEIYADIQALFGQLVAQSGGTVEATDPLVLAMSPAASVALTATNSFNVSVSDLLKKNFPGLKIVTSVQYGALTAQNPQGLAGGNMLQLIAPAVEGQETGYCAFSEKMREHPIVRGLSSFKQKVTAGTWGAIVRQAFAVSQMLGV